MSTLGLFDSHDLFEELVARGDLVKTSTTVHEVADNDGDSGRIIHYATTRGKADADAYLATRPDLTAEGVRVWARTTHSLALAQPTVTTIAAT